MKFYYFNLDLIPMALVLKPDLDIVGQSDLQSVYMCVLKWKFLTSAEEIHRQTDWQTGRLD